MAWEQKGGCRFYTRSRRVNGRVKREYLGTGTTAELAAFEDEQRRRRAVEARAALEREQSIFAVAAAPQQALDRVADGLMAAALEEAGYHRHDRGHWRKRRVRKER
jgi:hypothetical protein